MELNAYLPFVDIIIFFPLTSVIPLCSNLFPRMLFCAQSLLAKGIERTSISVFFKKCEKCDFFNFPHAFSNQRIPLW